MDAEQRQVAADLWTKPTDFSHKPACRQLRHYIHHRHLLFNVKYIKNLWNVLSVAVRFVIDCDKKACSRRIAVTHQQLTALHSHTLDHVTWSATLPLDSLYMVSYNMWPNCIPAVRHRRRLAVSGVTFAAFKTND